MSKKMHYRAMITWSNGQKDIIDDSWPDMESAVLGVQKYISGQVLKLCCTNLQGEIYTVTGLEVFQQV
jgi:hypothetical protein